MGLLVKRPIRVWCDSKAAIAVVKNPGNHKATKHVDIRVLYSRDQFEAKLLEISYCPTSEMVADLLTKALPPKQFQYLRGKMGVRDLQQAHL